MCTEEGYCIKCILKKTNPAVRINKQGLCNFCKAQEKEKEKIAESQETPPISKEMELAKEESREFLEFATKNQETRKYDCMLMLSGGKDSIYLLDRLVQKNIRPLAFTLNHPYESKEAIKNIERVLEHLGVDHISYTQDVNQVRKYLKHIFIKQQGMGDSERLPCLICSNLIRITSYLFAVNMNIPYIVYCADQEQIPTNVHRQIPVIMQQLHKYYEVDELKEIFGHDYEVLMDEAEGKPKFVFPYALIDDYDPEVAMVELREKKLYDSNPRQTHCSLLPLLNYYSIKRHDMLFYTRNYTQFVRNGQINRESIISYLEDFKKIMLEIAVKDEISQEEIEYITSVLKKNYPEENDSRLEYELHDILNLKNIAKSLHLDLDEI